MQNAGNVLLTRWSHTQQREPYNSNVCVLVTECIKLPTCLLLLIAERRSLREALSCLRRDILGQPVDTLKVSVPAVLYTVQNNLIFIAIARLEVAVFQILYQ